MAALPQLALKSDKKSILRFYKANHYTARFIGFDSCYFIKINNTIIASVIISQCKETQDHSHNIQIPANEQAFLHALVVSKDHRQQGYAAKLLTHVVELHHRLICFADESLHQIYCSAGFSLVSSENVEKTLLPSLLIRYKSYLHKKQTLAVFSHYRAK